MSRTQTGAVAAGHRLTAEAGAEMLRAGGNAIDAAIAALAMACVCEPVLASPGGGGFAMIRDGATGTTTLLDFFPQTPRQKRGRSTEGFRTIEADFGTSTQIFHIGPATVATPGILEGLEALERRGARLPHQDHFAPAIQAARDGVRMTGYQAYLSTVVAPILMATPASRRLFAPEGDLLRAGEEFFNPALGDAFTELGRTGWRETGIGSAIVHEQAASGHLAESDILGYAVEERRPLEFQAGVARGHVNPPPAASGALILLALRALKDCSPKAIADALNAADQARLSARGDLSILLEHPLRQNGTTHISTADADGNACAVTVSNGTGSGEMVDGYGFMLNNILGEEDVNPDGADGWPVNTRPASMMCPTILEMQDGRLIALGSGGSSRIRSAVFQTVARLGLDSAQIHDAVNAPRLHLENGRLDAEAFYKTDDQDLLAAAFPDHRFWPERSMFFGGVHAVQANPDGSFDGVGDHRREGVTVVLGLQ